MKIFFTVNPGLSYLKDHTRWSHMAPMQFAFVWPLKLRLCMGLFFCTFAQFPALFQSQFVLLSIFLITRGNLACFQKAHGQAADHQGGKAPKQGCANARRATKFELNTTVFCSPFGLQRWKGHDNKEL